nr:PAS domain S-box protein [Desulfobacula sp.]
MRFFAVGFFYELLQICCVLRIEKKVIIVSKKFTYKELEQRVQELENIQSVHKRVEKELRESEEKFRNIAEISLAGIYIIQDEIFIYVNNRFAEILGYSVEECLNNLHFRQTVHPEDLDFVREQISKRLSGEVSSVNYTFRAIKKNQEIIHAEIFGSKIQLAGKRAVAGSILDITARKQVEKQREELIKALQKALSEVKTLRGFLPICSYCKKIRDDKGYWNQIESYIHKHSDAAFSHGICPDCSDKLYGDQDWYIKMKEKKKGG